MQVMPLEPTSSAIVPLRSTRTREPWQRLQDIVGRSLGRDGKWRPKRRLNTRNRDAAILRLRSQGASIRTIAAELDWSVGTVHRVVRAA